MQPSSPSNYDFILNPQQPQKQPLMSGKSKLQRILIVGALFIILLMLTVIVISFFSKSGKVQNERLLAVAQAQTEIIRLTAVAGDKATDTSIKTLAATTRITTESDKKAVMGAITARGVKEIKDEQLTLGKNTKSDALLNEALANNRFDETYKSILTEQLNNYNKLLEQAKTSGSKGENELLNRASGTIRLIAGSYQPAT